LISGFRRPFPQEGHFKFDIIVNGRLVCKIKGMRMKFNKHNNIDDRKSQIISIAVDIFFEYGYQKASIRDIARKVGITQAAIYYYFRNKEEILYTIIDDTSNQLIFNLLECSSKNKDPVKKLKEAILVTIKIMKTEIKKVKILIEDKKALGKELFKLVKSKERAVYNFYFDIIKEIQEQNKLKNVEMTTAVFAIIGQINWLYHWYRPEGRLGIEEVAENIVEMVMFGLIKE
jgi:AcrR family transcriptional regulator